MEQNTPTIMVTGSSQGIGAATIQHFAKQGWRVVVTYMTHKEMAEEVVKKVGVNDEQSLLVQMDVMNEESVKRAMQTVEKKFGVVDVLVNNAGVDWMTKFETMSFEDWKTITRTKIDGNFLCTHYALPLLKKSQNAQVIVIASSLGDKPDPEDPAYSVGTAGTVAFMKAMAVNLAQLRIRVNAVCPTSVRTQSRYWVETGNTDEMWEGMAQKNPMGRNVTPLDVAQTIYTVVTEPSGMWNGNMVFVDGGKRWVW